VRTAPCGNKRRIESPLITAKTGIQDGWTSAFAGTSGHGAPACQCLRRSRRRQSLLEIGDERKIPALFAEFRETGVNEKLGFRNPEDLRTGRGLRPSPA
jgi:hypothetical protein